MGRIMLATSASTDEEYGGTTANMYKKISSNITDVAISSPIGSLYFADVNVDITSLGLSNAPTEVLVSYMTTSQGVAPVSIVVTTSTTTSVTVRFFRTDNNQKATGKITLLILD